VARSGNGSEMVNLNADDAKNPGQSEVIIIANEKKIDWHCFLLFDLPQLRRAPIMFG
jgi:hypothetical protein